MPGGCAESLDPLLHAAFGALGAGSGSSGPPALFLALFGGLGLLLLGRRLGLGVLPAACAGLVLGLSSPLSGPAGVPTALLPWALLGLERSSGPRRLVGLAIAAGASGLSLFLGPPGPAWAGLLAAGAWALAGAGWNAGPALPGLCALGAGALLALAAGEPAVDPAGAAGPSGALDLPALAAVLIASGAIQLWGRGIRWMRLDPWLPALIVGGLVLVLWRRGLEAGASELLLPGARGPRAGLALPVAALGLSIAGLVGGRAAFGARASIQGLAWCSVLLAIAAPGVAGLWRQLALIGAIDPRAAAGPAAVFLALVTGGALAWPRARARAAAEAVVIVLAGASLAALPLRPVHASGDPPDEVAHFELDPRGALGGDARALVRGSVLAALPAERVELRLARLDASSGRVHEWRRFEAPLGEVHLEDGHERRSFALFLPGGEDLGRGSWLVELAFWSSARAEAGPELLGSRSLGTLELPPSRVWLVLALAQSGLALALLRATSAPPALVALAILLSGLFGAASRS